MKKITYLKSKLVATALLACVGMQISGCSTVSPDVIDRQAANQMQTIQYGTVLSVRSVVVDGSQSGGGAIVGGVVGAIAGGAVGGHREHPIAQILGGVAGAVAGNAIERGVTTEQSREYTIRTDDGRTFAIVQGAGMTAISPGQRVGIIGSGRNVRVVAQ